MRDPEILEERKKKLIITNCVCCAWSSTTISSNQRQILASFKDLIGKRSQQYILIRTTCLNHLRREQSQLRKEWDSKYYRICQSNP